MTPSAVQTLVSDVRMVSAK